MKKLGIVSLLGAFVASSLVMFATSAWAVPVFARKYNVQCSLCHTLPPRLTKAGVAFKENGFEMPSALPESEVFGNVKLADDAIVPGGLPLTLRTGLDINVSSTSNPAAAAPLATPNAAFREFGLIGGGNVGGIGFWIDAPIGANAPLIAGPFNPLGALDIDFKFNDMAKVKVGVFEPASTINYGLGLTPVALGARNQVTVGTATYTPSVVFGNVNAPALELRGTTDATNGLGFNYAVGYVLPTGTQALAVSSIYGGVGYLFDTINTNFGLSYQTTSNSAGGRIAGAAPAAAAGDSNNTLLFTATWNVGNPFQVIVAYNSSNSTAAGVASTFTGWSIQPEFNMDKFWFGGRYATLSATAAGVAAAASPSYFQVGAGYRFLQNVIGSLNYSSASNVGYAAPSAANPDTSTITASIDLIL